MDDSVLEVKNLVKKFKTKTGEFAAVNDISFSVKEGEIVGFLGPNGAGKTTTIQITLGLTKPTSGKISIFGKDINTKRSEIISKVGFASTYTGLKWALSVYENLVVFSYLYSIDKKDAQIKTVLENVEMWDKRNLKTSRLSAGQITRVVIARALLNRPRLLLLDEPTASLDPDIAVKINSLLLRIRGKYKVTMLYTSHNMSEVTKMCDRVIFLSEGKIVAEDTPQGLAKRIKDIKLLLSFEGNKEAVKTYLSEKSYNYQFLQEWQVLIKCDEKFVPAVIIGLSERNIKITEIDVVKPNLEDVFLLISQGKFN